MKAKYEIVYDSGLCETIFIKEELTQESLQAARDATALVMTEGGCLNFNETIINVSKVARISLTEG